LEEQVLLVQIDHQLEKIEIRNLLSLCLFDQSTEGIDQALRKYPGEIFCTWVENGETTALCGFLLHHDIVEICHLSVTENMQRHGIGRKMVTVLCKKYGLIIKAETDDDAVGFYRKCGFSTKAFQKYGVRRWVCSLPAPKPLDQMTDEERQKAIYPIILSEPNPEWKAWFAEEKDRIILLAGPENIVQISHIGSTSVPGLVAKPTVDILLEITADTNIDKLITSFSPPEYICLAPPSMPTPPPHLVILKGYTDTGFAERVFHIHVRYKGDWDELAFRDYLAANPETAAEYADLKRRLHRQFEHDRDGYTMAKGEFIRAVTEKAKKK
jgi:GrpB-like predicted nucleotidyltransferase (UPF0157 family)